LAKKKKACKGNLTAPRLAELLIERSHKYPA